MARLPRIDLPGIPQHVVQRGNNRLPCFIDARDRWEYLSILREALQHTGCQLHAYVLMGNHVHMLVTPPEKGAVGVLMQRLGRRYVGGFNARHGRTGTLWEGRYKACLVDSDDYLLRCARYIDLNPVRARLTSDPTRYPWSSCAALCGQRDEPLLTPHPTQQAFEAASHPPGSAYEALLREAMPDGELDAIRLYLRQQRAWGRDDFRAMVQSRTQRFASTRPAQRPRREANVHK